MVIFRLPVRPFAVLGFCLFPIYSQAQELHFTTVSTLQENQLLPSKDFKKVDAPWSWSQPDTASSALSGHYSPGLTPGQNLNRPQGSVAQRTEYFPYPYEFSSVVEESQHVSPSHETENALGSITKHFATVSFIGLLLLFAIVQNSIAAPQRKEAFSLRKKRDLVSLNELDLTTPEQEEVITEDAKIRCMQRTLCLENQKLRKRLGKTGKLLAKYLTRIVESSLEDSSGWDRLLDDAGQAGIRGEDCRILYRDCSPFEMRR